MSEEWPKIRARRTTKVSPWVTLIEREVEFAPGRASETYHAVGQADYISIVALTPRASSPLCGSFVRRLKRSPGNCRLACRSR
jgi:ADP-ribose pyrophosphatase